jgi:hypothetical protein
VLLNLNQLIFPYLGKIKRCNLDAKLKAYIAVLDSNMKEIVSPFFEQLVQQVFAALAYPTGRDQPDSPGPRH